MYNHEKKDLFDACGVKRETFTEKLDKVSQEIVEIEKRENRAASYSVIVELMCNILTKEEMAMLVIQSYKATEDILARHSEDDKDRPEII